MIEGCEIIATRPHTWSTEEHTALIGCYFCRPQNFPPIPDFQTLCACCGNLIKISTLDPMNLAMEVCTTCADRFNTDSINTTNREGKS